MSETIDTARERLTAEIWLKGRAGDYPPLIDDLIAASKAEAIEPLRPTCSTCVFHQLGGSHVTCDHPYILKASGHTPIWHALHIRATEFGCVYHQRKLRAGAVEELSHHSASPSASAAPKENDDSRHRRPSA